MNEDTLHKTLNRVLATIALALGVVCMIIVIIAAYRADAWFSDIQDAFEGPTFPSGTYEPDMNPSDPGIPHEPWIQRGDDPLENQFCSTDPQGQHFCEDVTE